LRGDCQVTKWDVWDGYGDGVYVVWSVGCFILGVIWDRGVPARPCHLPHAKNINIRGGEGTDSPGGVDQRSGKSWLE